ncbi:VanZ family protein [Cellvibrio polysaccharolyticus]|uniref:VanZ family protein n=1 Tax=Cellvibrio polysaccharolyticus TaxID=2082724 RepID=UPI0019328F84|nr:VanZ family protein [Cellvibrio polysaccharolyticus]
MNLLLRIWPLVCYLQFLAMLIIYTVLGLTPSPGNMVPMYNDLLMHFTGYLVAGISISFLWPRWHWGYRALILLVYSIAIEVAQHFMPPRTFSFLDILANGSGILAGLLVFHILQRFAPAVLQPFFHSGKY